MMIKLSKRRGEHGVIKSEILGLSWNPLRIRANQWRVGNLSGKYHGLFKKWWDHFGLVGSGLIVGDEGEYGENVKIKLRSEYPDIKEMFSVGISDSDINCDIQKEIPVPKKMDWIICQAVLEHLGDPFGAVRNMFDVLVIGGRVFFYFAGIKYEYHAYPIDCCRFYRDVLFEWKRLAGNVVIEDILWHDLHCFVIYRRIWSFVDK